jgi:hypothetical protein
MSDCSSVCPFHMSHSNLRTPWPIHFNLRIVITIFVKTFFLITLEWKIEISPKSIQTVRLSIPITVRSLKWIGQGVLNLQCDIRKITYNLMNKVPQLLWCKIYLIKKNKKMGAVCGPFILAKAWIKKKFNLTNYIHQNCFNLCWTLLKTLLICMILILVND